MGCVGLHRTPRRDVTFVIGDFNAKIGSNNVDIEPVMRQYGLDNMNENAVKSLLFFVTAKRW